MRCWKGQSSSQQRRCIAASCLAARALTTTTGAPPTDHQEQQRPRRPKRLNYADYDRIVRDEPRPSAPTPSAAAGVVDGTAVDPSVLSAFTSSSSPYIKASGGGNHSSAAVAARLRRARLLLRLTLFSTPAVAPVMAALSTLGAYSAYLHGVVDFYTRHSTAAPLDVAAYGSPRLVPASSSSAREGQGAAAAVASTNIHTHTGTDSADRTLVAHVIARGGGFEQAAMLSAKRLAHRRDDGSKSNNYGDISRSGNSDGGNHKEESPLSSPSSSHAAYRGFLQGRVLNAVHIGHSPIHSRGLFTAVDLPKGTRVVAEQQRSLLSSPSFVRLLADTHQQLPDTYHYTHPSGSILELVTRPLPHHLVNHSCEANLCAGLSPVLWPAARASGNAEVVQRVAEWRDFSDANSFFTTRDVVAGEELTLDYSRRAAPVFAGENTVRGRSLLVCRCGSRACRHFVYQQEPTVRQALASGRVAAAAHSKKNNSIKDGKDGDGNGCGGEEDPCFTVAKNLLRLGFDDEAVILSLLPSRRPTVAYLYGDAAIPELAGPARSASSPPPSTASPATCEALSAKKTDLLVCYRHVFRLLNEAAPQAREGPGAVCMHACRGGVVRGGASAPGGGGLITEFAK